MATKNSICKALHPGLGQCSVCGRWKKLEMWDNGLNDRFCADCFDYVVDAEEALAQHGLVRPGPETNQSRCASDPVDRVMILFEPPNQPYQQLGTVSSVGDWRTSDVDILRTMQIAAAALEADAIIVQSPVFTPRGGPPQTSKTIGIAIKYAP
jgi:hypothetical protein